MSNDDGPILHFALNDITPEGRCPDASGHGIDATATAVNLVSDDVFGACAEFAEAGSKIEVEPRKDFAVPGDLTLETWVWLTQPPVNNVPLTTNRRNYALWYDGGRASLVFHRLWQPPKLPGMVAERPLAESQLTVPVDLKLSTWYHVTAVLQGARAAVFVHDVQGQSILPQAQPADWSGPAVLSNGPLVIGSGGLDGKLAHVRIYSRALSAEEIARDIRTDCGSLAPFRRSHPIDFRLYDDDEAAVVYITDDSAGHRLNVELQNTSGQPILLRERPAAGGATGDHHFALRFRQGTLSEKALKSIRLSEAAVSDWDLDMPPPAAGEETVSLRLRYKGKDRELKAGKARSIVLENMSAAPGSGTRGTQVHLLPNELTYVGDDETRISGLRTQYLHVTNQAGKKHIPLHVGFVGTDRLLNYHKAPNVLTLHITNVSKTPLSLKGAQFVISFDAQATLAKPWALTTATEASQVAVTFTEKVNGVGLDSETPEWPISFTSDFQLRPGEPLKIVIANIVSSLPDGFANVYVRYKVPGYWDGQFVCPVEKGPIVAQGGKVGIGVHPDATLDVKGSLKVESLVFDTESRRPLVKVARAPHLDIKPAPGWTNSGRGPIPQHFMDIQGVIHLSGQLVCTWPQDSNEQLERLEVFTLPQAYAPRTGSLVVFPARVEFSDAPLRLYPLTISAGGTAKVPKPTHARQPGTTEVTVYLDGISYLGG